MKLSVIVPVYNMAAEGKLQYCLESLVHQTFADMEIIAVDDASTDNSLEILRQYEKEYPGRVKVITYPVNRRQGGAKNEGLKVASGDWIGFIDSPCLSLGGSDYADFLYHDFSDELLDGISGAAQTERRCKKACHSTSTLKKTAVISA